MCESVKCESIALVAKNDGAAKNDGLYNTLYKREKTIVKNDKNF